MMRTPEQASATWCPMARASRTDAGGRCIADECAMWRWGEAAQERKQRVVPDSSFGPRGKRVIEVYVAVPTRGYCGLAGAPTISVEDKP